MHYLPQNLLTDILRAIVFQIELAVLVVGPPTHIHAHSLQVDEHIISSATEDERKECGRERPRLGDVARARYLGKCLRHQVLEVELRPRSDQANNTLLDCRLNGHSRNLIAHAVLAGDSVEEIDPGDALYPMLKLRECDRMEPKCRVPLTNSELMQRSGEERPVE